MDGMEPKEETWQDRVRRLGVEQKPEKKTGDGITTVTVVIFAVIFSLAAAWALSSAETPEQAKANKQAAEKEKVAAEKEKATRICNDTRMAYYYAQDFVKQNLKSPSSAVFPAKPISAEVVGACRTRIVGTVDSQNGFGAMIRSAYSIEIKYHKSSQGYSYSGLVIE
ncbi:hypothetical protein [Rheinheimera soli]|uniref:hypothetical protein n=1 Tax=Rheinheimera soli TaxID=443616 RepID=UPI001E659F3E|nr:hypothetical protein [Rheinheimera soli]